MKFDPSEYTPEEIQAMENSAKIRRFVGGIGWQCAVFTTVVYATYLENAAAEFLLGAYSWLLALAFISYCGYVLRPMDMLASKDLSKEREMMTPSVGVGRMIGLAFTIIEVPILITHGFLYLAIFWGIVEVLQHLSVRKIKLALREQETDLRNMTDAAMEKDKDFSASVKPDLDEFNEKLAEVDALIDIAVDEQNKEAAEELLAARTQLINEIEAVLTKAALETLKKD